ncbi:hypothetical protein [Kineococcus gypseus]|uniref:hypothetical protein n=1 Tax=Kineococcus gypseus TaxID=1637102 RepID=UPI003D7DDCA0
MERRIDTDPAGPRGAVDGWALETGPLVTAAWLLVVLALAGAYGAGVLWPYYANDLDAVPLAQVASGAHDPKGLWPAVGGPAWLHDVGAWSLGALLLLLPSAVLSVFALLSARRRARRGRVLVLALVLSVSVAVVAVQLSPLGRALASWVLD